MKRAVAALLIAGCIGFVGCGGPTSGPAVKSANVGTRPGSGAEQTKTGEDGSVESPNAGSTTSSATPQ